MKKLRKTLKELKRKLKLNISEGFFPLFIIYYIHFSKKVYNKNIIKAKEYQLNFNGCRNEH